jgi:hypothetical protein
LRSLVGYRRDFLPQMMFSRIHLFTVAAQLSEVTPYAVEDFTRQVSSYVKAAKGGMRGAQSGIAAFTVLVSYHVADAAKAAAERPATMEFAVRCQPVVIDLSSRTMHTFRGRQLWGLMLNGHLRRKLALYLPEPAAVGAVG